MYQGPNRLDEVPGLTDYANPDFLNIGDVWLTALYPKGVRISKIMALFSLSYTLGMLVRYYPTQSTALLRGQIADASLPTLTAAVELVEKNFPQLVVEFLTVPEQ